MNSIPRHNYEYDVTTDSQTAAAKVVRMVGNNKRVLEIGAGPGSITKILQKNNCRITGIEIDSSAIEKLSEFCEKVYQYDLNSTSWIHLLSKYNTFDVLVAADVLEHLYSPQDILVSVKPLISKEGYVVVSLPHVGNNAVIASIINADFEYRNTGLLDKTHIRFFGIKNMQNLFENAGYKILAAEFVITPPGKTELATHWNKLPIILKKTLSYNHFHSVYQVVIKAAPALDTTEGIQLLDLPIPKSPSLYIDILKDILRSHLSPNLYTFLGRIFTK